MSLLPETLRLISLLLLFLCGAWSPAWGELDIEPVRHALARGDWEAVEQLLSTTHDTIGLLLRGEARRALGHLDLAHGDHETVWHRVMGESGPLRAWTARTSAETLLAQGLYADAEQRLNAVEEGDAEQQIRREITRGHREALQGHVPAARASYLRARELAQHPKFAGLDIQAQLGLLDLNPNLPPVKEINAIAAQIDGIEPPWTRAALRLGLAQRTRRNVRQADYWALVQSLAEKIASEVGNGRQRAEFLDLQAELLEAAKHYSEALILTNQTLAEARRINASDLMVHEEWRRGRLYHILGDPDRALAALRRAVFHLNTMRSDIPVEYHSGRSSFHETLAPLYLKLADLLLQQAARRSDDDAQPLLRETRDTLERLKAAELEDYLGTTCPLETKPVTNLEDIAPRTAVLYPILLPDRMELLLGIGDRQYRTMVAVKAEEVRAASENLASLLRPAIELINPKFWANQLFSWIIAPVKPWLEAHRIETLVFIPDGPMRLFPLGALMDGDTFLIERYALVTQPGLTIFDPKPIARDTMRALVAGMSKPGSVLDELPTETLNILAESVSMTGFHGREVLRNPITRSHIEDALTLPGVEQEVKLVAKTLGVPPMLDQDFVLSRFSAAMKSSFQIVHVASHGYFGGTPENSFFMTYDRLLNTHQLETILQGDDANKEATELLTLSACQTAEGNDRAPLGIIGIAIKSGVRSAIGSLWPVSDTATQRLITEFYRRLRDSTKTKAQAFQQAQIMMLRDERFHHPFFWSPFILVGNWL